MELYLEPKQAAYEIWQQKYPDAKVLFLSGSVIRGKGTKFSDLDLVVVFEHLDYAWRENFYYRNWPIEALVHDPGTLKYFFSDDIKSGCPSLPQMVVDGIAIPHATEFSESLKKLAQKVLNNGPPVLTLEELNKRRYTITDLLDDMREPRSAAELMATGAQLFDVLADFYFRSNGLWSAYGKTIVRRLQAIDNELCTKFESAFSQLFSQANPEPCIKLALELLDSSGGPLFNGYRSDAPPSWRLD